MLIGLTVLGTDSIFAKGCNRTAVAFAFWCSKNGHSVTLISPSSIKNPFNELEATFKEKNIKCRFLEEVISSKEVYDCIFEIAWYIPEALRLKVANKHIIWFHQPPLFNDMESSVFFFNNFIRSLKHVSEVWIPDCYSIEDKLYIERIYSIPARFVPWIWEHVSLDNYSKNNSLSKWNQFENHELQLIVLESNNTNTSNCTLPLCIIAEITEKTPLPWIVGNGEILKKNKYFNGNVVNNLFSGKDVSGNFIGRIPVPELRKFKSVFITHQRWRVMKHLLLDALWLDIPMIHNCVIIQDGLKDVGGYFYPANEISTAVNQFGRLTRDLHESNGYFTKEALFQRKIFCATQYDWESDKSQNFFTAALSNPLQQITNLVKQPEIKNVLSIAFTDMWFDFNPKYNFFTCLLEDEIKKTGLALEVRAVEENPNLVIFGPFGDGHRKYDGIPKIFFSGENNLHIEGPEIILSIGHSPEVNAKTLRIPLWILEVNWFNADPAQIRNPKPIPYEVCTKPQVNLLAKKTEFASFIVSNPKNEHRNAALGEISKYKRVDSAGAHMNNMGMKLEGGLGGGGGEMVKHEFLQKYKFNICFENASEPGYITEKYFHAKAAGCIPIYWGDSNLGRDFNPAGGINTHGKSWDQVRAEIQAVDSDPIKYLQMFSIPAITPEAEAFARKQMKRLVDIILPFGTKTQAKVPAPLAATPPSVIPIQVPVLGTDPKFYTATNSKYLPNLLLWFEGLIKQKIPLNKATVYYWPDTTAGIDEIKQKYSAVTFTPFPVNDPAQIPWKDFWEPQHYGWKLWLIHQNLGSPGIYMDVGVLLVRPIADIYEIIQKEGVFMLEDENSNKNWCHEKFVKMMNCSEDELNSKQLQAAVLGWNTAIPAAKKLFTHAFYYTKARDILVGEKWIQNPTTHVYGHRHDQSILSILSYREKINRRPLAKFTTGESYKAAVSGGYAFFHHRGKALSDGGNSKQEQTAEFAAGINEAAVINLDKRTDRYQSFKDFHPYMTDKIKRHSACYGLELKLTPEIKHLFRNNDFKWKKAVMGCAISHNQIWQRLAKESSDDYSCLILEDDVRFYPKWLDVWKEASKMIPADADIIYLGGILPPNKQAFASAITLVNMHFAKVVPNEVFSPGNPRRYFHSCNYAYIMFARGARKIAKIIEERGIFTSGDHMIVNHMENLNVYFLHPIVAGCFQDTDPIYQKSQFNNFERVDNFDSDLWNNTEVFTPAEIQDESIKPAENNDTMANGVNIECNAILLKLSQGKIAEMTEMCLAFFEKELSVTELSERNFNWIRVIQQVLLSQKSKMTNELIINVISKLSIYCKITPNMVLRKITEEIIEKYNGDITARPPGVPYYPSPNFASKPYSVWYFVPNQQNVFLEREWLEEIIGRPLEFQAYGSSETHSSQPIHFLLLQKWHGVESLVLEKLNALATANLSAVLLHLSDENVNDSTEIYNHPAVKLVIRNYVRADIPPSDKIITIPLGYVKNRSLKGKFKKLAERTFSWSFAGSVDKPTRIEMLQTLSTIEPNSMKLFPTWKQPQPEEADEYMKVLGDSKFIPCPMGQNYETYRLYEALEAGCIPICIGDANNKHECYNKLIGDNAILISQDWTSVKSMIQQICNNPDALNQIQENLTSYWTTHKINITSHILAALEKISKNYL